MNSGFRIFCLFAAVEKEIKVLLPRAEQEFFTSQKSHIHFSITTCKGELLALLFSRYNCNGTYQHLLKEKKYIFIRDILQSLTCPRNIRA